MKKKNGPREYFGRPVSVNQELDGETETNSVTGCWNQKLPDCFKKLPKRRHGSIQIENTFSLQPKMSPHIWATF